MQVLPGNRQTWDISTLLITTHTDSDTDSDHGSASDIEATPTMASPELSEISKMLLKAKAAAEVGVACHVYYTLCYTLRYVFVFYVGEG